MRIGGLQKLTLLDYPGHVACTVFTVGCNFRCPFCHNSSLVLPNRSDEVEKIDVNTFYSFLDKRQGILDGVAITGGEPLLQPDIEEFIRTIREKGFKVKLDTNGSYPERLRDIIESRLVDYIAMDIKNLIEDYEDTIGVMFDTAKIVESINLIKDSGIEHEFRTTVVKEFHSDDFFEKVADLLGSEERYFLQGFEESDEVIDRGKYHSISKEELESSLKVVKKRMPLAQIRGEEIG